MALDLSKLNFFSRLDARARVLVLFGGILGVIGLVYLMTLYFSGSTSAVGPSRVASAPSGMQSIPGGKSQTAEYQRALAQANQQRAEAAKMSGTSSIPTQINTGISSFGGGSCVICSDKSADVKNLLEGWVRQGKIAPDDANKLQDLANKNVSVEEYSSTLDKLLKDGKVTPEQARALLDEYKKQHTNAGINEAAKVMDLLIKDNKLPISAANQLLELQKNGVSLGDYAQTLQRMVEDGKITPAVAQQLLAQYSKQRVIEAANRNIAFIQDMAANGSVTPDVAATLSDLTKKNVSLDVYTTTLNRLVATGKITPDAARKLIEAYRQTKAATGSTGTLDLLVRRAESQAIQDLGSLLATGKISPDVASQLSSMMQQNVSIDDYKKKLAELVQQKKISPEDAQRLLDDYTRVKNLREEQQRLADLQANNVTQDEYAAELKRAVAAGILTPQTAAQLMAEYQGASAQATGLVAATGAVGALQEKLQSGGGTAYSSANDFIPAGGVGGAGATYGTTASGEFVQNGGNGGGGNFGNGEFPSAQTQGGLETAKDRQDRLNSISSNMSGMADSLVAAWQPTLMEHREGTPPSQNTTGVGAGSKGSSAAGGGTAGSGTNSTSSALEGITAPPLIKGGTVIFAVLDTAINSDYPDSPVMATVVDGRFKGAKLMGKIATAKSVSGQLDRISLNFTLMNEDQWPKSKTITAYGIDPDTARTVLASTVDYHYMMRFGAMFASSFLQGYAGSISNAGSSTTGIFGTSTSHPELSPSSKFMVGLGQVGQTLGTATQNYVNRAPTVRVDSGVGLGILFMTDVS